MASPNQKLAESLELLKSFHDRDIVAIKSKELTRMHRERLLKNGFIKEVIKGWYIVVPLDEKQGETTSWFTSFWKFCARFLEDYGAPYIISPDHSLQIHSGSWTVPQQLIIRTPKKSNYSTDLLYGTSIWHWETPIPVTANIVSVEGINMMDLPSSLIHCTPAVFTNKPNDVRTALAMIRDASELSGQLLEGGHTTIAGKLAGAFRNIGREKIANDIVSRMQAAGFAVRETDPFENQSPVLLSAREVSPYVNRIRLMWHTMRDVVIKHFPASRGLPADHERYMKDVADKYLTDAYHSLSIERYRVTPELIERVRSGTWDNHNNEEDGEQKNAMAARGYWQAAQSVRESIKKILDGKNPGAVGDAEHGKWYSELFAPSVTAGIIRLSDLAGYRNNQVYIGGSMHVPMNKDAVRDAMPTLFELLTNETEASVRAVLGHFIFVFIHPYMDGNGRMGRFLMNVMLASGGYPWTVIPVEERDPYMKALEKASVEQDIKPFAEFLAYHVSEGIKGRPVAKIPAD